METKKLLKIPRKRYPGFPPFTSLLTEMYGPYGYSVSILGAFIGAFWGFVEGFWQVGLIALVYNWLLRS